MLLLASSRATVCTRSRQPTAFRRSPQSAGSFRSLLPGCGRGADFGHSRPFPATEITTEAQRGLCPQPITTEDTESTESTEKTRRASSLCVLCALCGDYVGDRRAKSSRYGKNLFVSTENTARTRSGALCVLCASVVILSVFECEMFAPGAQRGLCPQPMCRMASLSGDR